MVRNKINQPNPRIPKTQVGPHAKRNKKGRKRKLPKDWRTNPAKHETAPKFYLFLFQIVKKYRSWKKLQQDWDTSTGQGRGGGGRIEKFICPMIIELSWFNDSDQTQIRTSSTLSTAQPCERPPGNNCSHPTVEPEYTDKTVILYSPSRTGDHGKLVAD